VDDVAPVIAASVLFQAANNEAFFVGVDDVSSVNELAQRLSEAMGVPKHQVQHLAARKEVLEAYASHDKMRCAFNPAAGTSLKLGLEKTIAAMKAHGAAEPKG
jgi:UDP-glucose 4-epimerase